MRKRKMTGSELEFEPIWQERADCYIGLDIYPPGAWFGKPGFHVFVGGSDRVTRRTLASAKKSLLVLAIAECDRRIAQAKATAEHYEVARQRLLTHGLQPKKKTKAKPARDAQCAR